MGYGVQTIKGEVVILAGKQDAALAAARELDRHDELKSGWRRVEQPDGSVARRPHWAYTDPDKVASAQTLTELLQAFRYRVDTEPDDGEIYGVDFIGSSLGDDYHLWNALAPFIEPGSEIVWLGEDELLQRWSFDGATMSAADGHIVYESDASTRLVSCATRIAATVQRRCPKAAAGLVMLPDDRTVDLAAVEAALLDD